MPYAYTPGSVVKSEMGAIDEHDYKYRYPRRRSLKPGTDAHDRLRDFILTRAYASRSTMQGRFASWRQMDQMLTAYIPLSENEKRIIDDDPRKPVSMVVPVGYAVLETLLTYMTGALLSPPYFSYKGTGPEDELKAMVLEKVIDQQCARHKSGLSLYVQLRDAFVYGLGVSTPYWKRRKGWKTRKVTRYEYAGDALASGLPPEAFEERERYETTLFEGNAIDNIDPYMYLPDPNVAIHKVQDGEFVGWVERTNYNTLLMAEQEEEEGLFNVKYLKHVDGRSSLYETDPSNRDKHNLPDFYDTYSRPIDVIYMYATIIPKEMGVGASEKPEKWLFTLAGDRVIIQADPINLNHNLYPVTVCAPDFDGYSVAPMSRLENVYGLQQAINWLFNSHTANVRKAINDMFIVNPEMVNMADLLKPSAGKIIRLRRSAWGKSVKDAIDQFSVTDVTQNHINYAMVMLDLLNRITGAVDNLQGVPRSGSERVSATEASDVNRGASSKMRRLARIIHEMTFVDHAYMHAYHTQQFAEMPVYVDLTTGDWADVLMEAYDVDSLEVDPTDLDFDYDIRPTDGSMPNAGDTQNLTALYQVAAQDPELRQEIHMTRFFLKLAQANGFTNVHEFLRSKSINTQVQTPEQIQQGVQSGNLVPLEEAGR